MKKIEINLVGFILVVLAIITMIITVTKIANDTKVEVKDESQKLSTVGKIEEIKDLTIETVADVQETSNNDNVEIITKENTKEIVENTNVSEEIDSETISENINATIEKENEEMNNAEINVEDSLLETAIAETIVSEEAVVEESTPIEYIQISDIKISIDMDLTVRTGLSRDDFIKLLSDLKYDTSGFFEENAGTIYDLCEKYSINEIFFCGLISQESGWAIASNHRRTNNFISLMSGGKLISYPSVYEGLEVAAQKLHNNYLTQGGKFYHGSTLSGVKVCFCPASSTWVGAVYDRMKQILK